MMLGTCAQLHSVLADLAGVEQNPCHHPEGDALHHVLQTLDLAVDHSDDPQIWAAALLHDVGKVFGVPDHAAAGAELIEGLVDLRVVALVAHHMDLLYQPRRTRRRLRGTRLLRDLELLRQIDEAARSPVACVGSIDDALDWLDDPRHSAWRCDA